MPFARLIHRFLKNRRGAAAVEFAMIMTPLFALILVSLQTGIVFFEGQALQTAASMAARQILTGTAQTGNLTQTQFKTKVCGFAATFNCSKLMVDVQSAPAFTSITTTPITLTYSAGNVTNVWSYNPGNPGDIVIVRLLYNWPIFGGPLAIGLANQPGNKYLLVGTAVFKNEPYQ